MASPLLSATHLATLTAVCDTILPAAPSAWRDTTPRRVEELLGRLPNPDDVRDLRRLLGLLEQPGAVLALGGPPRPFSALSRGDRERLLRRLAGHRLNLLRGGFQSLKRLATLAYYAADEDGRNPIWPSLGYPGPVTTAADHTKPIHPTPVTAGQTIECDAVIVGSGAGGGMVAAELAEAGHGVVVLERGGYYAEPDFNQRELPMLGALYHDSGLATTADRGMALLAGSCLGGGTVVNYTTSFRLPADVRAEWASVSGLDFFLGADFDAAFDAAEARLHVNTAHNRPSSRDAIMERGLRANGWHVDAMPRDVWGCTQDDTCGYCGLGCVHGAKCSSLKTTLQAAYERGAHIIVRCIAERILIEGGRAAGILARTADGHHVTIRARVVVIAAGAICSPALLLRSGITGLVGKYLRLHPATGVAGRFDEEIRPWTGSLQALYSDQFARLDAGYGFRFETAPIHPALLALTTPWQDSTQFDARMRALPCTTIVGILLRDRDAGRVDLTRTGLPRVRYTLSRYDRRHLQRGVEAAGEVLQAAGARELMSLHTQPLIFHPDAEPLSAWSARVSAADYGANRIACLTFHQMGTCRMGADPRTAVVNGEGESHAVRNLFVADGSLFPTASGVNPMLTITALAYHVARTISSRL
jgi:long-chain-alcohol oxidase